MMLVLIGVLAGVLLMRAIDSRTDRQLISSGSPYEELAAYSRAVVDGDMVFVSGTVGLDPASGEIPEGAEAQARVAFQVIETALAEAGASLDDVVRTRICLTEPQALDGLVVVLKEKFETIRPANMTTLCDLLVPGALLEIEVTAKRQ